MGTPSYMAPEQAGGRSREIGPATDIYALGAILYELLTGRPPFAGTNDLETLQLLVHDEPVSPSRLRPRVPRDLEHIRVQCLQKEPRRRYATASALAEDLRRFLDDRPIQARRPTQFEVALRWGRRNPGVSALSMLVIALLVAITVGSLVAADRWRAKSEQARRAEREADKDLVWATLAEARASRRSGLPGRHFASQAALLKAIAKRGALDETDGLPTLRELGNEMIGSLVLADLEPARRWPGFPEGATRIAF